MCVRCEFDKGQRRKTPSRKLKRTVFSASNEQSSKSIVFCLACWSSIIEERQNHINKHANYMILLEPSRFTLCAKNSTGKVTLKERVAVDDRTDDPNSPGITQNRVGFAVEYGRPKSSTQTQTVTYDRGDTLRGESNNSRPVCPIKHSS